MALSLRMLLAMAFSLPCTKQCCRSLEAKPLRRIAETWSACAPVHDFQQPVHFSPLDDPVGLISTDCACLLGASTDLVPSPTGSWHLLRGIEFPGIPEALAQCCLAAGAMRVEKWISPIRHDTAQSGLAAPWRAPINAVPEPNGRSFLTETLLYLESLPGLSGDHKLMRGMQLCFCWSVATGLG
jgi:hypothetical protein